MMEETSTTEAPAETNGAAPAAAVKRTRNQGPRTDRLVLGYAQALNDGRKLARAKYGAGTTECNVAYALLDELEEGRDDGKSADEIAKAARAQRTGGSAD